MTEALWQSAAPGVLTLPSGRLVRGRGLGHGLPDGPLPQFGVYLLGRSPPDVAWVARWVQWPDFRLPKDSDDARDAFLELYRRAATERVEVACHCGRGRTGTALACIAVLDGIPPTEAVAFVREHYSEHAVETRRQVDFVERFAGLR